MVADSTLYDLLGVAPDAEQNQIRSAYLRMQAKYHPDRCNTEESKEMSVKINQAYEILRDAEKRQQYDRFGIDENGNISGGGGIDVSDIFGMFGMGRGQRQRKPQKSDYNIETPVKISLKEAFLGIVKKIKFKRKLFCEACNSTGSKSKTLPKCGTCDGRGQVVQNMQQGITFFQQIHTCPTCHGSGKTVKANDKCSECKGKAYCLKNDEVELKIDAGVEEKKIFTFANKGNSSLANKNLVGDLKIILLVKDHPIFTRVGSDLYMNAKIDYIECLCGFKRIFEHLNGEKCTIEHTRENPPIVTDSVLKIRGLGMKKAHSQGNLFVVFKVIYPTKSAIANMTEAEISQLREKLTPVSQGLVFNGDSCLGECKEPIGKIIHMEPNGVRTDRQHHQALVKEHQAKEKEEAKRQNKYVSDDEQDGEEYVLENNNSEEEESGHNGGHFHSQNGGGKEVACAQS